MPKDVGQRWLKIMHAINQHGPLTYLELERHTGFGTLIPTIATMKQSGYLEPLPKVRRELKRYKLSKAAQIKIGAIMDEKNALRYQTGAMQRPTYTPPPEPATRPGSRDAYKIPSIIQGRSVAPRSPA